MAEGDAVLVKYVHRNAGRHQVVFNGNNYGYHAGAGHEQFPISRADFELDQRAPEEKRLFKAVEPEVVAPVLQAATPPPPAPEPVALATNGETVIATNDFGETWQEVGPSVFDLSELPDKVRLALKDAGLVTREAVLKAGLDGLITVKGIGPATAKKIMELAEG